MTTPLLRKVTSSDFRSDTTLYKWVRFCCLFCIRGSGRLRTEGHEYDFTSGNLCRQSPLSDMEVMSVTDDLEGILLITDYEYILSVINMFPSKFKQLSPLTTPPVISLEEADRRVLEMTWECVSASTARLGSMLRKDIHGFYIRMYCLKILSLFIEKAQSTPLKQSRPTEILSLFFRDMLLHYKSNREMAFYAGLQGLSPRYFSAVVAAKSGHKPNYWINETILADIKLKLAASSRPVKELAYDLGFPSQASFCRFFKTKTGFTPQEYRKSVVSQ